MGKFKLLLHHATPNDNVTVGKFEALISNSDLDDNLTNDFAPYIKIEKGGERALFKTILAGRFKGRIYVNPDNFKSLIDDVPIEFSEVSKREFSWYRFRKDKGLILSKWGLGIAISGVLIDGSIEIGKIKPMALITLTELQKGYLTGFSMILKILGLILIFWSSVRDAK